ncbi:uncharacterized protein LOC127877886 isoform X1 [Dreissena polymorpha]|nr:uncharacterized protein LOC127877886 isoform X1 [Dreissena polymorpha]
MQIKKEDKDQKPQMPRSTTASTTANRCSILNRHRQWVRCTLKLLENVNALGCAVSLQSVGKGANSVTSMLHHHFSHLGYGERNVVLHMDNCSGQNKNNAVIGYGMWLVLTGLHDSIEFSTMEAGHTKFSPDWHFGLWKVRWRNTTVNTLEDVVETVRLSSRNGHNIPHLVQDPENPVQFYNWTEFLKPVFKPIPNLLSYHHFRMTSDKPGIVYVRRYASDAEEAVKILKKDSFVLNGMPPQLEPLGLSAERQWYLHDEIAPLYNSLCASTCPRPDVPKPTK